MTLIENILKKVRSKDSLKRYSSPPPELDELVIEKRVKKKKKKPFDMYRHVSARVDSSPPPLQPRYLCRNMDEWTKRVARIHADNLNLLLRIKKQHYERGKVDCRWVHPPKQFEYFCEKRRRFLKQVQAANYTLYERIQNMKARVETTASLERRWARDRRRIVSGAALPFVLFPPQPVEDVDPVFLAPASLQRPRVRICLRVMGGACLGWLTLELFSDVCPLTCRLFADLLRTDAKHTYIGSCFFTKVPQLYWCGGDVVHDTGFGCYMQLGRQVPPAAENYHFPHSMPGLVSMRTTRDGEVCGIFNITFKPLPQFDLKNVVFARVVRPNSTYEKIKSFGCALSSQPVVRIEAARFISGEELLHTPLAKSKDMTSLELLMQTAHLLHTQGATNQAST